MLTVHHHSAFCWLSGVVSCKIGVCVNNGKIGILLFRNGGVDTYTALVSERLGAIGDVRACSMSDVEAVGGDIYVIDSY